MDSDIDNPKRTSLAWKYFTRKPNFIATCNICNKNYSYKSSVSNLNKHWKKKHGKETVSHDDTTDCSDDDSSNHSFRKDVKPKEPKSTWQFFDVLDTDQFVAKCKVCGKDIEYDRVSDLTEHVKEHNAIVSDDEEWLENKDIKSEKKKLKRSNVSAVWQFMEVIDEEAKNAVCLICRKQLSYATSLSNLRKHIHRLHPHISIDEDTVDIAKKMIISTDGQIYEIATSDVEKDPIQMNSVYFEDSIENDIVEEQVQTSTPQKIIKVIEKRPPQRKTISKVIIQNPSKNIDDNVDTREDTSRRYTSETNSLDIFGQYIISLLKELPKHVSDQLQSDIVKQIFTAKIALESPYSVTLSDKPITVTINNSNRNSMPELSVQNTSEVNVTNSTESREAASQNGN